MSPWNAARPGDPVAAIDTPSLVLDLDAFERNLERMAAALRGSGVRSRAHAKAHKCPEIARRQVALGAVGICCQKVSEAAVFVEAGIADVLVTNEVVGRAKLEKLAQLASESRIGVLVDDARALQELSEVARAHGASIDVYVEVNVGADRCGAAPGEEAVSLARRIAANAPLRFAGLHCYHGSAQHMRAPEARAAAIAGAVEAARLTVRGIEAHELRVGCVTGAGLKASSVDSGMPRVWQRDDLRYTRASDEHGVIETASAEALSLGDALMLVPGHCDPTFNLYDELVCVRGDKVEAVWPISARGALL